MVSRSTELPSEIEIQEIKISRKEFEKKQARLVQALMELLEKNIKIDSAPPSAVYGKI